MPSKPTWLHEGETRETSTQRMLLREHVFPVCHPRLLPRGPLDDPTRITALPLIHKGTSEDAAGGAEWTSTAWFAHLGLNAPPPMGLRCANIATAIIAALQGSGVAPVRSLLARDALADGRLVRVLPETWDMLSTKVHLVRWTAALSGDARVKVFVAWLVEMAGESERLI